MAQFEELRAYLDSIPQKEIAPCCDMAVMRHHEVLFRHMAGTTELHGTKPVSKDTLYYLYSCTKPITAAAAMRLWQDGKLDLSAPVAYYLPEAAKTCYPKDGALVPVGDRMKVFHLLTMTAGFNYDLEAEPQRRLAAENPNCTTQEYVRAILASPLGFAPGERFEYSLCLDVLGAVIEKAADENFGDYLKKTIFDPLGMQNTRFAKKGEHPENLAGQYRQFGEAAIEAEEKNVFLIGDNFQSGGAGLFSTTDDYILFADAMACGGIGKTGERILFSETVDEMRRERLSAVAKNPSFGCAAGPGYGYGYGVRTLIDRSAGQRSPLGEFGWDGAAGAYILMDPTNEISIVYMQQVMGWPGPLKCHMPVRDLAYEAIF